jgi:hypothetical protein
MMPCGDSLGAVTVMLQAATEGGDRSAVTPRDSVAWLGQLNMTSPAETLDVQLYKNVAPFGAMLAPMTISLAGQSDFSTCGACVLFHPLYYDGVEVRAQPNYIATDGTLNVSAVPNGTTARLTATLSNVTFEHVMIDPSFKTSKLDDCTITLTSASIDSDVAGGTGGAGGAGDSVGAGGGGGSGVPACTSTFVNSPAMSAATFCEIFLADCGTGHTGYADMAACTTTYSSNSSTLQKCQSYHLCNANNQAAGGARMIHCSHAGTDPGNGVCMP